MLKKRIDEVKGWDHPVQEEFERQYVRLNYQHVIPALMILYMVEWGLYSIQHLLFDVGEIILWFQGFNTIMIFVLITAYHYFYRLPILLLKVLIYLCALGIMLFGVALVLGTQYDADLVHMFMMTTFGVAAFMVMPPIEALIVFGIPTFLFFFALPLFQSDASIVMVNRINVIIFNLFVWLLSYNQFGLKHKNFFSEMELHKTFKRLDKMARTDLMTALYNHTTILDILRNEMERANRYGTDLVVLLVDIDDFKRVNDYLGHVVGDEVIKSVADILQKAARSTDDIGRYGGEEFLVVMPNTDVDGAFQYFQRVRQSLQLYTLPNGDTISISAGIAYYQGEDIISLLKMVDERLYRAKQKGKDRCIADEVA